MNELTDQQLLRDYVERQSEAAFAAIVHRYVDLVYSAAFRMVCDAHAAKDATQSVFVVLAQNARQLTDRPALAGWLHGTARNLAAKTVRSDVRRRAREQEAAVMNELLSANPDIRWEHIAPHLDDALSELSEPDRDAVLLRYFKNHDLRSVGATLGISDDAAQKRVSRAVERLREFFAKRGITVGASGLVVVISANAVQAAPVGLAVTISTAAALAGTTIAATATATVTKTIAMTTLQKTVIGATLAAAIGTGVYEAYQASKLRTQVRSLHQQQAPWAERVEQLSRERDEAGRQLAALGEEIERLSRNTAELAKLRGEVARLRNDRQDLTQQNAAAQNRFVQTALEWKDKEAKLREEMAQRPDQQIPELQSLGDRIWLDIARDADLDTKEGIRKALARLRFTAENQFVVAALVRAVRGYGEANNGGFPADLFQLKPYFQSPVDDALLRRYEVLSTNDLPLGALFGGQWVIAQKSPVDAELDSRWIVGKDGRFKSVKWQLLPYANTLAPVTAAYSVANDGQQPTHPSQLLPYLTTPEQQAALERILEARNMSSK